MSTTPKYGRLDPGKRRVVHGALVVEQPALRLRRKHHVLLGRHQPKLLLSIELTVPLSNVTVTNLPARAASQVRISEVPRPSKSDFRPTRACP